MKKTFFPLLLCLLLSCQGCTSKTSDSVPELLEPSDSERTTVSVIRDDFSDREVYEGFVAPETTDLSFELDGTIQSILVSSGQYVNEGDSLVTLDITEEEQRISDLNAELEDLCAELAYTESLYTNRTEYLKAELNQIIEQEGYGTNYQLKRIDIDEYDLDYYQTTKDLNNQISADEQALSDLEAVAVKATLTAPHSGYFYLSSDLAENSYLTKGKNVCSITREDSLCFLSSYLDEADVKNASLSVLLHGNSYSVSYVPLSAAERSALSFTDERDRTRFTFSDNSDLSALQAGDTGFLITDSNCMEQVLQIPVNALFVDSAGSYVYLVENGTQKRQDVTTGPNNGIMTVIEEGLSEGDLVYVQQ